MHFLKDFLEITKSKSNIVLPPVVDPDIIESIVELKEAYEEYMGQDHRSIIDVFENATP